MIKSIAIYKPNNAVEKFALKKLIRQPNTPNGYMVTKIEIIEQTIVVTFSNDRVMYYSGMPYECEELVQNGKKKVEESQ